MSERIKIDDTYTYAHDNGHVQLLRNGLPWLGEEPGGFAGSKAWISAANEIESLRAKVAELEGKPAQEEASPERSVERMPSEVALKEYLVRANCDCEQCVAFIQTFQEAVGRFEAEFRADERAQHATEMAEADRVGGDLVRQLHEHERARHDAEQALADERAKRPDREQIARAHYRDIYGDLVTPFEDASRGMQATCYRLADTALSSLALEPEAHEEPKGRSVPCERGEHSVCKASFVTEPRQPCGCACHAPEAREVTDAEVHVLYIDGETYGYATFGGNNGAGVLALQMTRQQWHDLGNPKEVAVSVTKREAAREVSRG